MSQRSDTFTKFKCLRAGFWIKPQEIEQFTEASHIGVGNVRAELLMAKGVNLPEIVMRRRAKPQLCAFLLSGWR